MVPVTLGSSLCVSPISLVVHVLKVSGKYVCRCCSSCLLCILLYQEANRVQHVRWSHNKEYRRSQRVHVCNGAWDL